MARKRKIPARKHHGIRDPLKQQAIQFAKLKGVTNNPPPKGDDQKVSNRFVQFAKLANAAKSGKKIKRIRCGIEDLPKVVTKNNTTRQAAVAPNKIKAIKQLPNEDDKDYMRRVNRMTTESLKEAEYEVKYGVSVVRDSKTGAIVIKKKPPNEIDELIKSKKSKKPMVKGTTKKLDPKVAKELIKQAIKETDEEIKAEEETIEEYKKDVFKFGEVVHAPPTLTVIPRKATPNETVARPGKKDNLLLKTMLQGSEDKKKASTPAKNSQTKKSTKLFKGKLKGKRKDLPPVTRVMIEEEQSKIINMYRQLKKNKSQSSSS